MNYGIGEKIAKSIPGEPLKVIASFNLVGEMRPLYFEGEDIPQTQIDSSTVTSLNLYTLAFQCAFTSYGRQNKIRIYYLIDEHTWFYRPEELKR